MLRILPVSFPLLLAAAAHAQQPPIAAPPSADTLLGASRERVIKIIAPFDSVAGTARAYNYNPVFTTVQLALSRVAGVQVTPYSGAPGAWSTVRIRGIANVTGYSQPLYVVDGVPVYNTETPPEVWSSASAFYSRGQGNAAAVTPNTPSANPLLDIPVEDVAQVEVLKGAAATARYGTQGTNGVVLITTRRGADGAARPQPLRMRYAGWGGVQQVRQRYELLDAGQYPRLANQAATYYGQPAPYPTTDGLPSTDWQDQVLRTAGIQSHNLSVDGRTHHTSYYVAADYLHQTGVVVASGLNRYHLRANLDQQVTTKLNIGLKASVSQTDQFYAGSEPDADRLLQGALLGAPVARPDAVSGRFAPNPLFERDNYAAAPRTRRLLAQLSATYQFNTDWQLTAYGSREQADVRSLGYATEDFTSAARHLVESSTSTTNSHNLVADAALHYQHTYGRQHALTATLSYQRQQFKRQLERKEYSGYGGQTRFSYYQETWESPTGLHSPAARVGYTYAGRYEVQASLRTDFVFNDDYSRNLFHWYPGAQLSWHLHKEAFLANATGLSELTLRAGTGQTST